MYMIIHVYEFVLLIDSQFLSKMHKLPASRSHAMARPAMAFTVHRASGLKTHLL